MYYIYNIDGKPFVTNRYYPKEEILDCYDNYSEALIVAMALSDKQTGHTDTSIEILSVDKDDK